MLDLAIGLSERGERVDLLLVTAAGEYLAQVPPFVRVIDLHANRVAGSIPRLVAYLRERRPPALISGLSHVNLAALWARDLARVPTRVIVTERTMMSVASRFGSLREHLVPHLARAGYRRAERIVAVSQAVADDLASVLHCPRDRIDVVYNSMPLAAIREQSERSPDVEWFAPDAPPFVLGVGRLTPEKDFRSLILAFDRLRKTRSLTLVILGEGSQRLELERLIGALGLGGCIYMPGFVANPFTFMRRAAVVVQTSRWEGFPNALVQAMALGTPVVGTCAPGGMSEVLGGGVYGSLAPVGDVEAIANAILIALNRPVPAQVLRQRAEEFSGDKPLVQYLDLLHGSAA